VFPLVMNWMVDLIVGDVSGGISYQGCPPRVTSATPEAALKNEHVAHFVGCYVVAVRLPDDREISGFSDIAALLQVLGAHQSRARKLILSSTSPPYICNHGFLYRYDLPMEVDLGLVLDGFPAKVVAVGKLSPFYGRILPDQYVESIRIPGKDDLVFDCGGFTGHRVTQYLLDTANVAGRQIVVKDSPIYLTEKLGYSDREMRAAFDMSELNWNWLQRLARSRRWNNDSSSAET
jgi:hypothetical protein